MALFIQDTFTGSGSLGSHTGELGATWITPPGGNYESGGAPVSAITLDGAGRIRLDQATNGGYYNGEAISTTSPPAANYYAEVDFSTVDDLSGNLGKVTMVMRSNGAFPNYSYVTLLPKQTSGGGRSILWCCDRAANLYSANVYGPIYTGVHTLRAEVEGATIRAYIDGVLVATLVGSTTVTGSVGFAFGTDGATVSNGTVLYEFRAGTLADPVVPTAFWTANIKATEVFG